MTKLAHKICGQGPDLILLHGWGMHSGIWQPVLEKLTADFRVMLVDLPGHGNNVGLPLQPFEKVVDEILEIAPECASWVGWSLGGQFAISVAERFPERVNKLMLVASNPCFQQRDGWPHGMNPERLEQFANGLESDWKKTIQRFLALQFLGSDMSKSQLRQLQYEIVSLPPDINALRAGLDLLQSMDLREELVRIEQPVQAILGELDRLVPLQIKGFYAKANIETHIFERAGHVPFVSCPDEFTKLLKRFFLDG